MKHLLILISLLILSSPVIGENHKRVILFRWDTSSGFKWKGFGESIHPKFEGEVKDGIPNGVGTLKLPGGDKYIGEFKDGKRHGKGSINYSSGGNYEGEWKEGKKHGQGTSINYQGIVYEGEFKDGLKHGKGKETRPDGRITEGEFDDGEAFGQGTISFRGGKLIGFINQHLYRLSENPSESSFEGKAINWRLDSGGRYTGEFSAISPLGYGKLIFDNGIKIVGVWGDYGIPLNLVIFDEGSKKTGIVLDGKFSDNISNGFRKRIYPNGIQYIGEFNDGKEHGRGEFIYPNGDVYEGEFVNGLFHGKGLFSFSKGGAVKGEFKEGDPWNVKGDKEGELIIIIEGERIKIRN